MANEYLKNALRQAGMTAEQFAEIIQVDPKTVQRWVAGRTPYPRYRATIARTLDLPEHQLWPDTITPPPHANPSPPSSEGVEVTGAWGYLDDPGAPDPATIITQGDGPIDLVDNGRGIRLDQTIAEAVIEHASAERPVRILTYLPGRRLEPLIGHPHIDIRVIDAWSEHSMLRAGETMLLTFNLPVMGDGPPPLLSLEHGADGGVFDRLLENLDTLWDDLDEILTDPEQLEDYRTNTDDDEDDEEDDDQDGHDDRPDLLTSQERPGVQPHPEDEQARSALVSEDPEHTPRRWPRRSS